jgi:hypothetical protein
MGQRQRMSTAKSYLERAEENVGSGSGHVPPSVVIPEQEPMEVDGIDSMMAGVKSRGVCLRSFCTIAPLLTYYLPGQRAIKICQGSFGLRADGYDITWIF